MTTKADGFNEWCIVELFGHNRIGGLVSEQSIGGCSFVRVDVPASEGRAAMTKFYGDKAVYCMTPVTEELARAAANAFGVPPISRWELPPLPPPGGAAGAEARPGDDAADDDPFGKDGP